MNAEMILAVVVGVLIGKILGRLLVKWMYGKDDKR
mgnify:CR=1 FL=1